MVRERSTVVPAGAVRLDGDLGLVEGASGIVVFAHGSGSSRRSTRNRAVAAALQDAGLATLLFDLLTEEEERVDRRTRALRFDIDLLADRLVHTARWLADEDATHRLRIGLFGASTGAAAALVAAGRIPDLVHAVVSRGGRPDLAGGELRDVRCPVLLLVGEEDRQVLALNREAAADLPQETELTIVPGAGHLFEEPGALEEVARLTTNFLLQHLGPTG